MSAGTSIARKASIQATLSCGMTGLLYRLPLPTHGLPQTRQITRTMYNSYNFNSFTSRPVEGHKIREVFQGKHSGIGKQRVLDLCSLPETRMGQKKPESFISHFIKVKCCFNARVDRDVVRLFVKVATCLRPTQDSADHLRALR